MMAFAVGVLLLLGAMAVSSVLSLRLLWHAGSAAKRAGRCPCPADHGRALPCGARQRRF